MLKSYKILLLLMFSLSSLIFCNNGITVESKKDTGEYSLGDYIISATNGNIEVSYYLRDKYIDIRYRNCENVGDNELFKYHRLILSELVTKFTITDYSLISWGSFSQNRDYSKSLKIALLSSKSELYMDYRMNYPDSKLKYLNEHFVDLCNNGEIYNDIKMLFKEYGADIELRSVEKVFTGRVDKLPFKDELLNHGLKGNDRVIFDSGMIHFKIVNTSL